MYVRTDISKLKFKKYYCYSPPLSKWLQENKDICPISSGVYKKQGKFLGNKFDVYILGDELKVCLEEWSSNAKKQGGK